MGEAEPVTPAQAQPVIVRLPAEIDMVNADAIGEELAAMWPGPHVLRVMKIQGVDTVLPIYRNLDQAPSGLTVTPSATQRPPFTHGYGSLPANATNSAPICERARTRRT